MQLKASNISFKYKNSEKYILENIDFEINSGEIVGLIAPSGFGKTTFAKILSGYEKNFSGDISIDGKKIKKFYNPIQLILQHPEKAVNPKWKMSKILKEAFNPSKDLLDNMGIKEEWLNRCPNELSGGELQRICVIRALSKETKFLIADEMTTMLDAITQAQIWDVVLDYAKKNNIGIIVISHEKFLIDRICERVVNLEKFKVKNSN